MPKLLQPSRIWSAQEETAPENEKKGEKIFSYDYDALGRRIKEEELKYERINSEDVLDTGDSSTYYKTLSIKTYNSFNNKDAVSQQTEQTGFANGVYSADAWQDQVVTNFVYDDDGTTIEEKKTTNSNFRKIVTQFISLITEKKYGKLLPAISIHPISSLLPRDSMFFFREVISPLSELEAKRQI